VALVLAVEPDQRQAAILTRVIQERIMAELIVVDSRDAAIAALTARVPDVILLTALLSPRDEDEMVAHLRTLADADHVQTHTIPQLASAGIQAAAPAGSGGLLSKFRRKKEAPPISGCDPGMFAEEVRAFLARAAELKAHAGKIQIARAPEAEAPRHLTTAAGPESDEQVSASSAWSSPFEWRRADGAAEAVEARSEAPQTVHPPLVVATPIAVTAEEDEQRREVEVRAVQSRAKDPAAEKGRRRAEAAAKALAEEQARAAAERERVEAEAAAQRERASVEAVAAENERARLEAVAAEKERARLEAIAVAEGVRVAEETRLKVEVAERERAKIEAEAAEKERSRLEAIAAAERVRARLAEETRIRVAAEAAERERVRVQAEAAEKERARLDAIAAAERERARVAEETRLRLAAEAAEQKRLKLEAIAAEKERVRLEAAEKERARLEAIAAAERERVRVEAEAAAERERVRLEAAAAAERERVRLEAVAAEERERIRLEAEAAAAREQQRLEAAAEAEREQRRIEAAAAERVRARAEREKRVMEAVAAARAADPFAEFRIGPNETPSLLRLMPLAFWARRESSAAERRLPATGLTVAPPATETPADELRDLIAGLSLPPQVAGVSYARGCRIRRVRVPASTTIPRMQGAGPVIVSKRALEQVRAEG
jgi:hypothetical protein